MFEESIQRILRVRSADSIAGDTTGTRTYMDAAYGRPADTAIRVDSNPEDAEADLATSKYSAP